MENYIKKQLQKLFQGQQKVLDFIEDDFFDWYGFVNINTIENEWLNPEFLIKLGYNSNQKENKTVLWKDLLLKEDLDSFNNVLKNTTTVSNSFNLVFRYYQKNGSILPFRFKGLIVKDPNNGFIRVLGTHENIYENTNYNKEQNKKLNFINLALKQENKELKQFSYLASHDLQQPVNNIISYLSILEENSNELNELGKLSVDMIKKSSYKMKGLITSLLEYSIIGTNGTKNSIDLDEVLSSVKDVLSKKIEDKNAILKFHLNKNTIVGYKNDIQLLFLNLVENALKFSKKGSIPKIKIDCKIKEDHFLYCVSDNGIGISETYFNDIFDIFYKIQNDENLDSAGIGLAECKKIVELYGGKIWVESEENKGASFYFTLPKNI